jgi:hypothetical protein
MVENTGFNMPIWRCLIAADNGIFYGGSFDNPFENGLVVKRFDPPFPAHRCTCAGAPSQH